MKERNAFILYKSYFTPISGLTDEQLGRLFRAIFEWQINGKANPGKDIEIPFQFFVNQFNIDNEKYQEICGKNRNNARSRWNATAYDRMRPNAKDNDKDKDKDKDKENDKENDTLFGDAETTPTSKNKSSRFVPPTLEQVRAYFSENTLKGNPDEFFFYYDKVGWKTDKGASIKKWESAAQGWSIREGKFPKNTPSAASKRIAIEADPEDYKSTIS